MTFPSEEPPELPQPARLRASAITRIIAMILVRILMVILLFCYRVVGFRGDAAVFLGLRYRFQHFARNLAVWIVHSAHCTIQSPVFCHYYTFWPRIWECQKAFFYIPICRFWLDFCKVIMHNGIYYIRREHDDQFCHYAQ